MMIASWFLILIVAVAALLAFKLCGRSLLKFFAFGLLMFFFLQFIWLMSSYDGKGDHKMGDSHVKGHSQSIPVSTEAMWQHLNRSRIVLDDKTKADETKADVAKKEVPEEIELTEAEEPKQNRPAWVDHSPKRIGNVYRVVVSAGPYKDEAECYLALEPLLSKAVKQRIKQLVPGSQVPDLGQLGIGMDYILRDLCDQAWVETSEASFGEMKQVYVQMQFGAAQDEQLRAAFRNHQRQSRVAKVGGLAGLGLGGLALLYGLLKIAPGRKAAI